MSKDRIIAFYRHDATDVRYLEFEVILERLKSSLKEYVNHLGLLQAGPNGEFVPYYAYAREKVNQSGRTSLAPGPYDAYLVSLSIAELKELINQIRSALKILEGGDLVQNLSIILLEMHTVSRDWYLYRGVMNDPTQCPKCGEVILSSSLKTHLRHPECRDSAIEQEVNRRRLYFVDEDTHIQELIQTESINLFYMPNGYRLCVPQWVQGAINAFTKNPSGYAGLTLHEYLDRMASSKS